MYRNPHNTFFAMGFPVLIRWNLQIKYVNNASKLCALVDTDMKYLILY